MPLQTKILAAYLLLVNLSGLILCAADKWKAKTHRWRIPEKTLFLVSGLGGAFGFFCGMWLFHHKTRHLTFLILIPLFMALWVVLLLVAALYGFI